MMSDILIRVLPTPNPFAWKFVINKTVLNEGKASFATRAEAEGLRLAEDLFDIQGVTQVHFFTNVITITHANEADATRLKDEAAAVIQTRFWLHDPDYNQAEQKRENQKKVLSPELLEVDGILDRTIRPGLQADGGDIELVAIEGNKLIIRYQGACGTCPSATAGTLMAIESILRDEYKEDIEVIPI